MLRYLNNYEYGSDLLMILLILLLAWQHMNSGTNLHECDDQSWFRVKAVS
jgi:hypothetical protein